MFTVKVSDAANVLNDLKTHNSTHWISLRDVGDSQMLPTKWIPQLHFNCEDIMDKTGWGAPTREQVKAALAFTEGLTDARVMVNCFAGVSRSTAIALAILFQHHRCIETAVELLVTDRVQAAPNPVITEHADQLLGCNGRLFQAGEDIAINRIRRQMAEDF